jgi:hypothetical protein
MRIAGGVLILGVVVAVVLTRVGTGPIVTKVLQWGDEIEGEPIQLVAGSAWRFQVPPNRWYVSKRKYTDFNQGDGVSLERALVRPEGYAVAFLFATKTGPLGFDLDALTEEFSRAWAKKVEAYKLHGVGPLPGRGGTRVMHLSARVEGRELEALCGLYPSAPVLYSLVVGAPPRDFPALRAELERLLVSFEFDTRPPAPAR